MAAMAVQDTESEGWDRISRQVRANMGLGRDKFARLLQVTPRTVMRWENGEGDEKIVPQGIQRMKLLALSLNALDEAHDQAVLGDMLQQATTLRADYETKATTIRLYEAGFEAEPPVWLEDLIRLKSQKNWSALALLGPHFLPSGEGVTAVLAPEYEALVCLWIGLAHFMEGAPQKAAEFYERGLTLSPVPQIVRCVLLSNCALASIRLRRFEPATFMLFECLRLDPTHRGALRNRMVLHAQTDNESEFIAAVWALAEAHPEVRDAESELGRDVRQDPDLATMVKAGVLDKALSAGPVPV
jgi:transcriptional regulator with XRE-family HTH domain